MQYTVPDRFIEKYGTRETLKSLCMRQLCTITTIRQFIQYINDIDDDKFNYIRRLMVNNEMYDVMLNITLRPEIRTIKSLLIIRDIIIHIAYKKFIYPDSKINYITRRFDDYIHFQEIYKQIDKNNNNVYRKYANTINNIILYLIDIQLFSRHTIKRIQIKLFNANINYNACDENSLILHMKDQLIHFETR